MRRRPDLRRLRQPARELPLTPPPPGTPASAGPPPGTPASAGPLLGAPASAGQPPQTLQPLTAPPSPPANNLPARRHQNTTPHPPAPPPPTLALRPTSQNPHRPRTRCNAAPATTTAPRRRHAAHRENPVAVSNNKLPPPHPRRRRPSPEPTARPEPKQPKAPKIVTSGHSTTLAWDFSLDAVPPLRWGHAENQRVTRNRPTARSLHQGYCQHRSGVVSSQGEHAPRDRHRSAGRTQRNTRATGDIP
jgi:hypothetical protein